ncbi:MAG TPA: hypothetical protein ENI27_04840 [bacterium]|nr:hypothetical protein [bacterium]
MNIKYIDGSDVLTTEEVIEKLKLKYGDKNVSHYIKDEYEAVSVYYPGSDRRMGVKIKNGRVLFGPYPRGPMEYFDMIEVRFLQIAAENI